MLLWLPVVPDNDTGDNFNLPVYASSKVKINLYTTKLPDQIYNYYYIHGNNVSRRSLLYICYCSYQLVHVVVLHIHVYMASVFIWNDLIRLITCLHILACYEHFGNQLINTTQSMFVCMT